MQLLVIPLIYAQTQYFLVYQAFVFISNFNNIVIQWIVTF